MVHFTAFYTEYGTPKTGLAPTIDIRRIDTGALVVAGAAMTDFGSGFYKYDYVGFVNTIPYAARCDGGSDTLDERYTFGYNIEGGTTAASVWDEPVAAHTIAGTFGQEVQDTYTISNEVLDLMENKLVVNDAVSELWLYDDAGVNVIKKWPLRDKTHLAGTVSLANLCTTTPVDRYPRTL